MLTGWVFFWFLNYQVSRLTVFLQTNAKIESKEKSDFKKNRLLEMLQKFLCTYLALQQFIFEQV